MIPKIIRTGPLIICRMRLTVLLYHAIIDQIQASSKNYSKCFYITDLVSVINSYINNPRDHNHRPLKNSLAINTQIWPPANELFQILEVHDARLTYLNKSFDNFFTNSS